MAKHDDEFEGRDTVTLTLDDDSELECIVLNIFKGGDREYIALLPLDENGDNTDGQIYLETEMFNAGFRPAVNAGLSVSRVGGSAQIKAMKKIAGPIRTDLAQYRELAAFAQFGSELDDDTKERLDQGERIREILKQPQYQPLPVEKQVAIIYAAVKKHLLDLPVDQILDFQKELFELIDTKYPEIFTSIAETKVMDDATEEKLIKAINEAKESFRK